MPSSIANLVRVQFEFDLSNGENGAVVQHCLLNLTPTQARLAALAAAIETWATTGNPSSNLGLMETRNVNTELTGIRCTALGTGSDLEAFEASNTPGSNTGNPLPPESALVTTWYTGFVGRSNRGRSYWPGQDPDTLDTTGEVNATQVNGLVQTMQDLVNNAYPAGDAAMHVYSRKNDTSRAVTAVAVRAVLHHIRGRNG